MSIRERETLQKAIEAFGEEAQYLKCAEECNELSKEILKAANGEGNIQKIKEEVADVNIMIQQMKIILSDIERENGTVAEYENIKVERLRRRIEKLGGDTDAGP